MIDAHVPQAFSHLDEDEANFVYKVWDPDTWEPLYRSQYTDLNYSRSGFATGISFDLDFALDGNLDNYVTCPFRLQVAAF